MAAVDTPSTESSDGTPQAVPDAPPSRSDRVLVAVFWVWAGVLLVATLAQLMGWDAVLDVLDVKRWFAR